MNDIINNNNNDDENERGGPLALPTPLGRGGHTRNPEVQAEYWARVEKWCEEIKAIWRDLTFQIGTREWCYLLEEHGLRKVDFDKAEDLIVKCRKRGLLPLDIVAEDQTRAAENLEEIDETTPDEEAARVVDYVNHAHLNYHPLSFWEFQDCYVEVMVEKAGLRGLFVPVGAKYHAPVGNLRGSSDLHARANILRRMAHWQAQGKKCVLLYCGDFDVHGLRISAALRSNLDEVESALIDEAVFISTEDVEIERIGLNIDFIRANRLSWIRGLSTENKDTPDLDDPMHPQHFHADVQDFIKKYGVWDATKEWTNPPPPKGDGASGVGRLVGRKVEASALVTRPREAQALCERAILQHVSKSGMRKFYKAEAEQQALVEAKIKKLLKRR